MQKIAGLQKSRTATTPGDSRCCRSGWPLLCDVSRAYGPLDIDDVTEVDSRMVFEMFHLPS
jgi:hypothetical protein